MLALIRGESVTLWALTEFEVPNGCELQAKIMHGFLEKRKGWNNFILKSF